MKRCPQCEFIYEDDQSHCDMDGTRLTHDAHPLPRLQTVTIPATEIDRPKWRSRALTATAATILASVLALVYFVSTHQPSRGATNVTMPVATAAPVENGAESVSPSSEGEADKKPEMKQQELRSANAIASDGESSKTLSHDEKTEEKPLTTPEEPDSKPQSKNSERGAARDKPREREKEESKVRSMFNKTKRFFKKNLPL